MVQRFFKTVEVDEMERKYFEKVLLVT